MIKIFVAETDLIYEYPKYASFQNSNLATANLLTKAKYEVEGDLYNKGYKARLLMIPLTLLDSENINSGNTTYSDISDADEFNRKRIYYKCDGVGTADKIVTLTLQGSNSETGTFVTVLSTSFAANTLSTSYLYNDTYKHYKVLVNPNTAITDVTVQLYENVYDRLMLYKSLMIYFKSLSKEPMDNWDMYYSRYKDLYQEELDKARIGYDVDEDDSYDEDTERRKTSSVSISR